MTKATRDVVDLDTRTVKAINFDPACTAKSGSTLLNSQVVAANGSGVVTPLAYSQSAVANSLVQRTSGGEITGVASQARYADLAERYLLDPVSYSAPGLAVTFSTNSGQAMVRAAERGDKVLGVISTAPGFKMNADWPDDTHPYIGLLGQVPCMVKGEVAAGDELVCCGSGVSRKASWIERTFRRRLVFGTVMKSDFRLAPRLLTVFVGR